MLRSWNSVAFATVQPSCSWPTRFARGTCTSSKKTSLKPGSPVICTSGRTVMPGAFMSIRMYEMPRCFGASGSVRTRQNIRSAYCAPEVQIFCPLTTNWSPTSSARVRSDARSEPEPGSEYP